MRINSLQPNYFFNDPGAIRELPLQRSREPTPVFAIRQSSLVGAVREPPPGKEQRKAKTQKFDWLDLAAQLGDHLLRADFDFYDLPFNRNVVGNPKASSGPIRYSEYNPKNHPLPRPTSVVPKGTFGRAHAEVRPIRRSNESLLTRFTLDYQGSEVQSLLPKPLRPLTIDCFTAVTSPTIEYDRKFDKRDKTILKIGKDGSTRYQNACREGKLATPFDSVAEPPPPIFRGTHPDWMFYFQPVRDKPRARILERFINRHVGALWLWANNPTFGFTDPKHYERFGIRYNTWPRRFGDLIRFFEPLTDPAERQRIQQAGPFLNPNTEYLDERGLRRKIPDDSAEWKQLNLRRKSLGLPEVPINRGPAVDWTFSDFLGDPKRMAQTPTDRFPRLEAHLQFKPKSELRLPGIGTLQIGAQTDVQIAYILSPEVDCRGRVQARALLNASFGPLDLGRSSLRVGNYRLKIRESLRAESAELQLPMIQEFSQDGRSWKWRVEWAALRFALRDLRGKGIEFENLTNGLALKADRMRLEHLEYGDPKTAPPLLKNLQGEGLEVRHRLGSLRIERGTIAQASWDGKEARLSIPYTQFHLDSPLVTMPPKESFLKNGEVRIGPNHFSLQGDLTLRASEVRGVGTDVIRLKQLEVTPHLEDVLIQGSAYLEYTGKGFYLKRREGGAPLEVRFKMTESKFTHRPFDEEHLKAHPTHRVIQSEVDIAQAMVELQGVEEVEYRTLEEPGKPRGQLMRLKAGPILLHHLKGGGEIWVNTYLWSWLQGDFPHFGAPLSELPEALRTKPPKASRRPDAVALLSHLDAETRKTLWDDTLGNFGNFIRIGKLSVGPDPENHGATRTTLRDLNIFVHETGHHWQFASVGIPELSFWQRNVGGKLTLQFQTKGKIFTHVFLKEPRRGHSRFELKPVQNRVYSPLD